MPFFFIFVAGGKTMINTQIRLAILGYGKECSKKNAKTASLVGKIAAKQGISLIAGNVTGTFAHAFEAAREFPITTICVIEKHKKPSDKKIVSELYLTKDSYAKHSQISQMADAGILIGGGAGSQQLLNHFLKNKKTVVAIERSGGITNNELPPQVLKARNTTEAFKMLKSIKSESYLKTELGVLKLSFNHFALSKLNFSEESFDEKLTSKNEYLSQLKAYFSGTKVEFTGKLYLEGSDFQKKVWRMLLDIPYGNTQEYGELAKQISDKKTSGAIAYAAQQNPIEIIIPCHRLLTKRGALSSYSGSLVTKSRLLDLEKHQTELRVF